jgi:alkylhydroperoxidase family enzyme
MARIDYSDPAAASERTREILGKNRNANIFRMMAHSPSYLEQYCRLGGAIRNKGELDPVIRELAITRTGILCEAPYEVAAHKRIGGYVGRQTNRTPRWTTGRRRHVSMTRSARRWPSPMRSSNCIAPPTRPSRRSQPG